MDSLISTAVMSAVDIRDLVVDNCWPEKLIRPRIEKMSLRCLHNELSRPRHPGLDIMLFELGFLMTEENDLFLPTYKHL